MKMKVRIRKPLEGGGHLKKGVITVETEKGNYYRIACEGCGLALKLHSHPLDGKEVYCPECQNIANVGKPETRLVRHYGKYDYETPCDDCGTAEQTSFLPKRVRPFLCNSCLKTSREKDQEEIRSTEPDQETRIESEVDRQPEKKQEAERPPRPVAEPKMHEIQCSSCRRTQTLKFKPSEKRPFLCPNCYVKKQQILRGEKPDTQVLFNLECNDCGKRETLNFIPTFRDRALCSACFEKMKRSKK